MKWLTSLVIFAALATGCTRTVYLPLESSAVTSVNSASATLRADTVTLCDTVTLILSECGDTVTRSFTRWRTRVSTVRDTLSIVRTDTVVRSVPVVTHDARSESVPWYRRWLEVAAKISIIAAVVWLAVKFVARYLDKKFP